MRKNLFIVILLFIVSGLQAQVIEKSNERYVKVIVSTQGKVYDNTEVKFTLKEKITLDNVSIPQYTNFYATAHFADKRICFDVNKIEAEGQIYDINLSIVGKDFEKGLVYNNKEKYFTLGGDEEFLFKLSSLKQPVEK